VQPCARPGREHCHQHCGACADEAQDQEPPTYLVRAKSKNGQAMHGKAKLERSELDDAAKALLHELSTQRPAVQPHDRRREGLGGPA
jgi:hypothetical protein